MMTAKENTWPPNPPDLDKIDADIIMNFKNSVTKVKLNKPEYFIVVVVNIGD